MVALARRGQWGLAANAVLLAAAALWMAGAREYAYGAYKLIVIDWWCLVLAAVAGAEALVRLARGGAAPLGARSGGGIVLLAVPILRHSDTASIAQYYRQPEPRAQHVPLSRARGRPGHRRPESRADRRRRLGGQRVGGVLPARRAGAAGRAPDVSRDAPRGAAHPARPAARPGPDPLRADRRHRRPRARRRARLERALGKPPLRPLGAVSSDFGGGPGAPPSKSTGADNRRLEGACSGGSAPLAPSPARHHVRELRVQDTTPERYQSMVRRSPSSKGSWRRSRSWWRRGAVSSMRRGWPSGLERVPRRSCR